MNRIPPILIPFCWWLQCATAMVDGFLSVPKQSFAGARNFNGGVEMSKQFARKILREVPSGHYWQVLFPDGAHEEYFGKSHDGKTAEQQADEAVAAYNEWSKKQLKIGGYSE